MLRVSVNVKGEWVELMCGAGSLKKLGEDAIARRGTPPGKFKLRRRTDGALLNQDEPIGNVLRNNDFVDLGNKM